MAFWDFSKSNKPATPPTTGLHLQTELITAIVNALLPYRLLPHNIVGLKLHLLPQLNRQLYETVLGAADFRNTLDRNLQDQFLTLPPIWTLTYQWSEGFPDDALKLQEGIALVIFQEGINQPQTTQQATLTTLRGQLAQESYVLQPDGTQYNIGRGRNPDIDGRMHKNQLACLDTDEEGYDEAKAKKNNAPVSRAHAYIAFDKVKGQFCLYAYNGGLPIRGNSSKIYRADGQTIRLDLEKHPYPLQQNDQIELGGREGVSIEFTLNNTEHGQ